MKSWKEAKERSKEGRKGGGGQVHRMRMRMRGRREKEGERRNEEKRFIRNQEKEDKMWKE